MRILLSIKPEFAELILTGQKRYEFRRVCFRNPHVRSVLIYATLPIGKVIGQFDIEEVISDSPSKVWRRTKSFAGVTQSLFTNYFSGKAMAHALAVCNAKSFARPRDLRDIIPSGIAPQSFCYVPSK